MNTVVTVVLDMPILDAYYAVEVGLDTPWFTLPVQGGVALVCHGSPDGTINVDTTDFFSLLGQFGNLFVACCRPDQVRARFRRVDALTVKQGVYVLGHWPVLTYITLDVSKSTKRPVLRIISEVEHDNGRDCYRFSESVLNYVHPSRLVKPTVYAKER